MNRTRSFFALSFLAVAALALSGCKKPESDPSQTRSTAANSSTATSTASVPPSQTPSGASEAASATSPAGGSPEAKSYSADGTIDKVDAAAGTVTISHGAVAALGWQPMTMEFHLQDKTTATNLKAGEKIHFDFRENSGQYLITRVQAGK